MSHLGPWDGSQPQTWLCFFSRQYLVNGLEQWNFMTFHPVVNFIIPTDELHHFSEGKYTTNQTISGQYVV